MTNMRTLKLIALLVVSLLAMALTTYTGTEAGLSDFLGIYTGLAYGGAAGIWAAVISYALDHTLFYEIDTWNEIEEGNSAVAFWAAIVFAAIVAAIIIPQVVYGQTDAYRPPGLRVVDTAAVDLGKVERPRYSNEGALPKKCLSHVGLSAGYPYCAACVSYWTSAANAGYPTRDGEKINTAATRILRQADCTASPMDVIRGQVVPDSGAIPVHQKGNGPYGHAGVLVEMVSRRCYVAIEANTTPGEASSSVTDERDGGGVYRRKRCLTPSAYFSVVTIVLPPHQC